MFRLFFVYFSFILYNFYIYLQYLNIKQKHNHAHMSARINNYKQNINIFTISAYYCLYFVNYKLNINILIISPNPCRFYPAASTLPLLPCRFYPAASTLPLLPCRYDSSVHPSWISAELSAFFKQGNDRFQQHRVAFSPAYITLELQPNKQL